MRVAFGVARLAASYEPEQAGAEHEHDDDADDTGETAADAGVVDT